MKKRVFHRAIVIAVVLVLGLATWSYAGANWKEEQAKIFSQIGVKPGDVIDQSNWEKVKDLLPPAVANWVKTGDQVIKVGEVKYDYDSDSEWQAATAKNEGKYDLDETGELKDKATGKEPLYVYGEPFPKIDVQNDPNAAIKIAHNVSVQRARVGNLHDAFHIDWMNREDGVEKSLLCDMRNFFYYAVPGGPRPNPSGLLFMQESFVLEPSDLEGMITMTKRYIDKRPDDFYAYAPQIRRVKRLSGTSRSDPFVGSDFTEDLEMGWAGKNSSMKWKLLEKKIILLPVSEKGAEMPIQATKEPNGAWKVDGNGFEVFSVAETQGAKGAPWCSATAVWVPRMVYVLEGTPVDRFYNAGKIEFYVDPAIGYQYTVMYDKSMSYWKTQVTIPICVDWGDGAVKHRSFSSSNIYYVYDEKTKHACIAYWIGTHGGRYRSCFYNSPAITADFYTPEVMATRSR